MIFADTSGLVALLDSGEPAHATARRAADADAGPLVVTDFVLAETDFLVLKRLGRKAERSFVAQLLSGALLREQVTISDLRRAAQILERFGERDLGLTDGTSMAVAERLGIRTVLTLDRRHFGAFRTRAGDAFDLVPA